MNKNRILEILKVIVREGIDKVRSIFFEPNNQNKEGLFLITRGGEDDNKSIEIIRRLRYFDSNLKITVLQKLQGVKFVNYSLIGITDNNYLNKKKLRLKSASVFDFDYDLNYVDGWEYHRLLMKLHEKSTNDAVVAGRKKLLALKNTLTKKYSKSYILGTGPSLEKAITVDWSDGIRIVSNTIVKDQLLWKHIDPHFIVAADAIYHFGISKFAENFRSDLRKCLSLTNTYFVFPAPFYVFCLKEFPEFKDRLIPIPQGKSDLVHMDLTKENLPRLGNILPLLLLPLSCTFSKQIFLWGFDGRSSSDKLFWKNSSKHFYTDLVDELMVLHPAFFDHLVPKNSPESYVKAVHGTVLENAFTNAEKNGFTFKMMHFSYTETLSKRYE